MACDGVWDVMSSQQVCNFVRDNLGRHIEPHTICGALLDNCLAKDDKNEDGIGAETFLSALNNSQLQATTT